jgi:hypothetical protein
VEVHTSGWWARTSARWATQHYQVSLSRLHYYLTYLLTDSIHSGTTTGYIKMNFGRSERLRYKKYFIAMYSDFLQKCYSEFRSHLFPDLQLIIHF